MSRAACAAGLRSICSAPPATEPLGPPAGRRTEPLCRSTRLSTTSIALFAASREPTLSSNELLLSPLYELKNTKYAKKTTISLLRLVLKNDLVEKLDRLGLLKISFYYYQGNLFNEFIVYRLYFETHKNEISKM